MRGPMIEFNGVSMLRITVGKVYVPAHNSTASRQCSCIENGKIVADVPGGRTLHGHRHGSSFPAASDIHTHVAGGLSLARACSPRSSRRAERACTAHTLRRYGGQTPTRSRPGSLYRACGYTPSSMRQVPFAPRGTRRGMRDTRSSQRSRAS